MTATNTNPLEEALSALVSLEIDERLAVLASLYARIAKEIPANAIDGLPAKGAADYLVTQIEQLPPEEQLSALRTLLPSEKTDQDAVVLDPNPTKALTELVTGGGTKIPTQEYGSLKTESKLAFWYLLAQKLGSNIIGLQSEYKPTQQATQVLTLLESLKTEELVTILKQVV